MMLHYILVYIVILEQGYPGGISSATLNNNIVDFQVASNPRPSPFDLS